MDYECYKCEYFDLLFDGEDEFPLCQCPKEEDKPQYCSEKEYDDVNTARDAENI